MHTPLKPCDLLIHGKFLLPMTDEMPVISDGALAIKGNQIVDIGIFTELKKIWSAKEALEGGIILPGLVNTHGHAPMTLYRGLGDGLPTHEWLTDFIWPAEEKFTTPENVKAGAELAIGEMIASGTTTFTDMYFFEQMVGEAAAQAGMRVMLGQALLNGPFGKLDNIKTAFLLCEELLNKWNNHPLVNISMALHSTYTLTPEFIAEGAKRAIDWNIPIQTHVSETIWEVEECIKNHGMTPTKLIEEAGALRQGTICAHGVHLTEDDITRIVNAGAGVALNPQTNLKLGSGIAPIDKLINSGMLLGLGTDGACSNNHLDLWESIRLAALLPKGINQNPTLVDAKKAIWLATRGGAKLLGLESLIGSLEIGKRADICIIDTTALHLSPIYSPWPLLAYSIKGSDVLHTVIDGKVVFRNRKHTTLDISKVRSKVQKIADKIQDTLER